MKLAVSYENGQVSPHFGQSKQFQFYDVADGVATPGQVLDVLGAGHAAVTAFLAQQGAQAVISGFVGGGARQALEQAGIALYPNVTGAAQERAQQLAQGTLVCGEEAPAGAAGCAGHSQVEAHGIGHEPMRAHLGCGHHGQHGQHGGHHGHHQKGEFCHCQGKIVE